MEEPNHSKIVEHKYESDDGIKNDIQHNIEDDISEKKVELF